ncbi:hypothetical protein [Bremerella cremea]|uniref:hypothetical protein n=1 Tax=Bremerella cremea TaxID=1031537 RepID=UPI0031E50875
MWLFLEIVAGFFVAFILLVIVLFSLIRWKYWSFLQMLVRKMADGQAGQVPPFRLKLVEVASYEDDWVDEAELPQFERLTAEWVKLGFQRWDDYSTEEIMTHLRVLAHDATGSLAVVYCHPLAKVWCDVSRRYEDGTSWTYTTISYHGLDLYPPAHMKFLPQTSPSELWERFQQDAPEEHVVRSKREDFPQRFEIAYAAEMDWRIERGGPTEDEILRAASLEGVERTDAEIRQIQSRWRIAIAQFFSDRVLKNYRSEAELNAFQWDFLQNHGVVIHERMQAEDLLQLYDEDYYPDVFDEDDDFEEKRDRKRWNERLKQLEGAMRQSPPQKVFRDLVEVEADGKSNVKWEYQASVVQPVAADIWVRTYEED